jgi:hypothetical protein
MVHFHTKTHNFGLVLKGLGIKNFEIFYDNLVYVCTLWSFFVICYSFPILVTMKVHQKNLLALAIVDNRHLGIKAC